MSCGDGIASSLHFSFAADAGAPLLLWLLLWLKCSTHELLARISFPAVRLLRPAHPEDDSSAKLVSRLSHRGCTRRCRRSVEAAWKAAKPHWKGSRSRGRPEERRENARNNASSQSQAALIHPPAPASLSDGLVSGKNDPLRARVPDERMGANEQSAIVSPLSAIGLVFCEFNDRCQ